MVSGLISFDIGISDDATNSIKAILFVSFLIPSVFVVDIFLSVVAGICWSYVGGICWSNIVGIGCSYVVVLDSFVGLQLLGGVDGVLLSVWCSLLAYGESRRTTKCVWPGMDGSRFGRYKTGSGSGSFAFSLRTIWD